MGTVCFLPYQHVYMEHFLTAIRVIMQIYLVVIATDHSPTQMKIYSWTSAIYWEDRTYNT